MIHPYNTIQSCNVNYNESQVDHKPFVNVLVLLIFFNCIDWQQLDVAQYILEQFNIFMLHTLAEGVQGMGARPPPDFKKL